MTRLRDLPPKARARAAAALATVTPDERAEVRRLATKGARRGSGAARTPRTTAGAPVPSEHEEQAALVAKCDAWAARYPELGLLYAIQNEMGIGGRGGRIIGAKRKAAGRRPGVPDLHLPVPREHWQNGLYTERGVLIAGDRVQYHGLYVELKRRTGGRVSPEQAAWHERLRAQGYRVEVCRGADEAWQAIVEYLGITDAAAAA